MTGGDALELFLYFLLGVGSALIPVINAEAGAAGAAALDHTWVSAVVLIGLGQGVGKTVLFVGVRRGGHWVERFRRERPSRPRPTKVGATLARWSTQLIAQLDRPIVGGLVVFVSAISGVPPLLLVAVTAALSRVPLWVFTVNVVCGRIIRFFAIAYPVASAVS